MFKKLNYLFLLFLFPYLASCSLGDSLTGFGNSFFENKFYYKNGHERVQLEEQDISGRPNIHPVNIASEKIEGALRLILIKDRLKTFPIFNDEKVANYAVAISEALIEAQKSQDVVITIEGWYKAKYLKENKISSARIFYNKNGLNIIFGSIFRKGNMHETDPMVAAGINPDLKLNPYVPGSRTVSIKNKFILTAPPNSGVYRPKEAKGRIDWLVLTNKALRNRSRISEKDRTLAQRSTIEVQSLHDEVSKLRNELKSLQSNNYSNQNFYPNYKNPPNYGYQQNYQYPPAYRNQYNYQYPPNYIYDPRYRQNYSRDTRNYQNQRNYNQPRNTNSYNSRLNELKNLRKRGLISKESYELEVKNIQRN
ncbi:hypothetical protein OA848_04210 [Rickettsiales bacterium]|nr:hypothetical protein [Rickettsiales bacterium]